MSLLYCYGIVASDPKIDVNGFESKKTYVVPYKDMVAIVSDVSEKNFSQEAVDKNVKDMKWLTQNGQIHERVVDEVMKNTTIIPMKFCTVFSTQDSLRKMMEEKYADFKHYLGYLKGKVEMGVKVYYNVELLKQNVMEESEDVGDLHKEIKASSPGAAYFVEQKIDTLVKAKLQHIVSEEKGKIFAMLQDVSEEVKQNELLHKKVTGKDMLLNVVFLMQKDDEESFRGKIKDIKKSHKDMEFVVWGPFPPYNFVK